MVIGLSLTVDEYLSTIAVFKGGQHTYGSLQKVNQPGMSTLNFGGKTITAWKTKGGNQGGNQGGNSGGSPCTNVV